MIAGFPEAEFREAVAREKFLRDSSYEDITERVGRFELRHLTLRDYTRLVMLGNPLAMCQVPNLVELATFLWLMSPEYDPNNERARKRFFKRCRFLKPPTPPLFRCLLPFYTHRCEVHGNNVLEMLTAVMRFVNDAFSEVAGVAGRERPQYYSVATAWVGAIARDYGWSEQEIMDLPMKRIFQYFKEIQHAHSNAPLGNPSDRIKNDWLASQDAKIKRN